MEKNWGDTPSATLNKLIDFTVLGKKFDPRSLTENYRQIQYMQALNWQTSTN